jgi:ketol-acid reductoisomerase
MIREHHKIRRFRGEAAGMIEPFRRADWIDVSLGVLSFGLPRERMREILREVRAGRFAEELRQEEASGYARLERARNDARKTLLEETFRKLRDLG